jgi:hypothetical protein
LEAGEWLHQKLQDIVWEKIHAEAGQELGELVELFSDIAEDVANQVVNTFATNWSDTAAKDSEDWRNTVDPGYSWILVRRLSTCGVGT